MELKELALRTRAEIEQELDKMCPLPENPKNADEIDRVQEVRVEIRRSIERLQVEALLDGKLTIDQVVAQLHTDDDDPSVDDILRDSLKGALDALKEGGNRGDIICEIMNNLELL